MISPGPIVSRKVGRGDSITVVATARGRKPGHDRDELVEKGFAALRMWLTFGDHVDEREDLESASVASRVANLHTAKPCEAEA